MTLYSSSIDSLIVYIIEGIALTTFICTFFIKKRKVRKIVNSAGGALLFILFVFGIFFDLKDFLVLFSLLTIIVFLVKLIIEETRKKHIWITLISFVLIGFSVKTHVEIIFLLSLSLSVILFLSFSAFSYYETRKKEKEDKTEFNILSLISGIIFSLLVCTPFIFLVVSYNYSQLYVNMVKETKNASIEGNLVLIFVIFLILLVFLFIYEFTEDRSEKEWFQ